MMDFDQTDITDFLRAAIPARFQDLTPYDFEKFIAWLFRQDGYLVEETDYSGDYGADLLIVKNDVKTVVQVKRYAPGTHVGVNDINQVIGARTYYDADRALVITTSDYTAPGISLAKTADIVLWDWLRFQRYLSDVLFDGEDLQEVISEPIEEIPDRSAEDWFTLTLLELNPDATTPDEHEAIEVHLGLENTSMRNLNVHLHLPIIVPRRTHRQASAIAWKENYFFHGMLVNGATVEIACYFLKTQIPEIRAKDRILFRVDVSGEPEPLLIDERLEDPRSNCYVVSFCYGRESPEYRQMISFRDNVLMIHSAGRFLVRQYYRWSPIAVRMAQKHLHRRHLLTAMVRTCMHLSRLFSPMQVSETDTTKSYKSSAKD